MLVTGGRDGTINVWSCHRGRHLQTIHKAHLTNVHSSKGRPILLFYSQVSADMSGMAQLLSEQAASSIIHVLGHS